MTSYTTLPAGPRTRILSVHPRHGSTVVTTVADPADAATIADALTEVGTDLSYLVEQVLTSTGTTIPDCDPDQVGEVDPFAGTDATAWVNSPADTDPVDVTRRALAQLDAGTGVWPLARLAQTITDQPPAVRRAVRDEVAALLRPWDGIQVAAWAYDRKWNDASQVLLIHPGLTRMDDEHLAAVLRQGDLGPVLDELAAHGEAEIAPSVTDAADQGYLNVLAHPGQLRAWLTANRPHLLADYETGLRATGLDR